MSRALRRFHRKRMYDHARFIIETFWFAWITKQEQMPKQEIHKIVSRHRDNMKMCSCWMCCNPRRSGRGKNKLTFQEIRAKLTFDDWDKFGE